MQIVIPYKPLEYQIEFHRDTNRFRLVVGGRRVGKTVLCLQEAIKHCLSDKNRLCYWVAPTYHSAKEIGFDEFLKYIDVLKPSIHTIHHTRLKVTFKNGSVLYFKGSDNPDSLRGRGLTMLVIDEAAFVKPTVWSKILRPALSDRKGIAILVSTPNGFNWFKDLYDKGRDWSKYLWPTNLNPLISSDELEAVQCEISRDEYRQEYLAEFVTRAGRVYDEFTGQNIIQSVSPTIDKYDIFLGMDFGFAHHTAIAFMAVDRTTGEDVIQFDEIYVQRFQIEEIINLIRIKLNNHKLNQSCLQMTYSDPAGNADELSSGISPVDALRNNGFKVINKGSTINGGIALVRAYIRNSLGKVRYYITDNCIETIRSFNGYQYNSSKDGFVKEEPLKDNLHDHLMDAVRYFFVNKFDHAKYVAKTPEQSAYTMVGHTRVPKRCTRCKRMFISNTPVGQPPLICSECAKG
jgi:PBSX family phage terminase large subunit